LYPVLFKLGPLEIKSYGLMLAVAFMVGYLLALRRAKRNRIDHAVLLDLSFYILLSAVVGSRLFYVLTHWGQFSTHTLEVFYIWEGGLSMMGGVLLSLVVSFFFLKAKGVSFALMADTIAPSIAVGIALTRVGCFLYGCCYGLPTELAWGVQFPPNSAAGSHFHQHIHPTQLYSAGYGLVIFLLLLAIERKRPPAGVLFGSLLALYAPARFIVDFFRYYEPEQYLHLGSVSLTNNQLICILLFALGAYLIKSGLRSSETRRG